MHLSVLNYNIFKSLRMMLQVILPYFHILFPCTFFFLLKTIIIQFFIVCVTQVRFYKCSFWTGLINAGVEKVLRVCFHSTVYSFA